MHLPMVQWMFSRMVHHVGHVAVAGRALDTGLDVALVREVHGRLRMEAVDAHPRRLFVRLANAASF